MRPENLLCPGAGSGFGEPEVGLGGASLAAVGGGLGLQVGAFPQPLASSPQVQGCMQITPDTVCGGGIKCHCPPFLRDPSGFIRGGLEKAPNAWLGARREKLGGGRGGRDRQQSGHVTLHAGPAGPAPCRQDLRGQDAGPALPGCGAVRSCTGLEQVRDVHANPRM